MWYVLFVLSLSIEENYLCFQKSCFQQLKICPVFPNFAEKSSLPVAEQCAWALGNVAGEGEELRNVLLSQGALPPLARMMLPNKGSTVRTAAWALSNLIKVLNLSSKSLLCVSLMQQGLQCAVFMHVCVSFTTYFLLGLRDLILKPQQSSSKLMEYLMQFFDTCENRKCICQIKHIEFC